MRQKEWLWSGALFFALIGFISVQVCQNPLYSGLVGGVSALIAAILFGYGLHVDTQERSASNLRQLEITQKLAETENQAHAEDIEHILSNIELLSEEIKTVKEAVENDGIKQRDFIGVLSSYLKDWSDEQQKSYNAILMEIQTGSTKLTGKVQMLCETITGEGQVQLRAFEQIFQNISSCFESEQTQIEKRTNSICDLVREQQAELRETLSNHFKESENYYKYMVDQPWTDINKIANNTQLMSNQMDSIYSVLDTIQDDTPKQFEKALGKLKEDSESLQEQLKYVCDTLEQQGKESRDAMERVIQGYSDVTTQDMEVLTSLLKDIKA